MALKARRNDNKKTRPESPAAPRLKLVAFLVASAFASATLGNPNAPQVKSGNATFATSGNTLTVTNSPGAIIHWQGFSIQQNEATRFRQQNAASAVLNRVVGQDPSQILGTLTSNGRVFLVNPNGVVFGAGSRVDVQGLVATALNIGDQDFLANKLNFQAGAVAGAVVNQGTITTPQGGQVYLVAPNVENHGIITSPKGEVILAAGKSVKLVDSSNPALRVEIQSGGNAVNVGQIIADGGKAGIYAGVIDQRGLVRANTVERDATGRIVFRASGNVTLAKGSVTSASGAQGGEITIQSDTGTTLVAGRVEAKGEELSGGTVKILGKQVGLTDQAVVDASGRTGGGTILIGGDFQGRNPQVPNARVTYVGPDVKIRADAVSKGDGGKVVVWADGNTRFHGNITAKGGDEGGDGGFVEVSGRENLRFTGTVSTSAPNGRTGTLLLDPTDITINSGANFSGANTSLAAPLGNGDGIWSFTEDTGTQTIGSSDIVAILSNTNLTLQASNSIVQATGVDVNYLGSNATALTYQANNSITISSGANIRATGSGKLDITLHSRADDGASGSITLNTGSLLQSNGGNIVLGGGSNPLSNAAVGVGTDNGVYIQNATMNAGGGDIRVRGQGSSSGTNGISIVGSNLVTTGTGQIVLTGVGGTGNEPVIAKIGVLIGQNSTLSAVNGAITLTGSGGAATGGSSASAVGAQVGIDTVVQTTGSGNISITGTGSASTGNGSATGVTLIDGAKVQASGSGHIVVMGTGGNGQGNANGISVVASATSNGGSIVANGGTIALTGVGGNSTSTGADTVHGVAVGNSKITANGGITIAGTGGVATGAGNVAALGYTIYTGSLVQANLAGSVVAIGTGGTATGTGSASGAFVGDGATVQALGTGLVSLSGNAGTAASGNAYGITVSSSATSNGGTVSAASGEISISGVGGLSQTGTTGALVGANSSVSSGGTITITGNAGSGTAGNASSVGAYVVNGGNVITSSAGNIVITGRGDYSDGTGHATGVAVSGELRANGTGSITLTGTGGNTAGDASASGVSIFDGAKVSTQSGALDVTGTGGNASSSTSSATGAYGVVLAPISTGNGATLSTTSGNITITATGGTTSNAVARGLVQSASTIKTTAGGNISITGHSGTSSNGGTVGGVRITGSSVIDAQGAGRIVVTGDSALSDAISMNSGTSLGNASGTGGVLLRTMGVGAIALGGNVQHFGTVTVNSGGGGANQSAGRIVANGGMHLLGSGNFTLTSASNDVGVIAANVSGQIDYVDASSVTVGSLSTFDGVGMTTSNGIAASGSAVTLTAGTNIAFASGTSVDASSLTLAGGGNVTFASGPVTLNAPITATAIPVVVNVSGSTVQFDGATNNLGTLTVSAGTLTGTGDLTISGAMTWTNGTISGSGNLITGAGVTTIVNPPLLNTASLSGTRTWQNFGTVEFQPATSGVFSLGANTTLNNHGTFNFVSTSAVGISGTGNFNNLAGAVVNKNFNASVLSVSVAPNFDNDGTVNVNSGTLVFQGAGGVADAGNYVVASGTTLAFSNNNGARTVTGSIAGDGNVRFENNVVTYVVSGTYNVGGATSFDTGVWPGTLTMNGSILSLGTSYTQSGIGSTVSTFSAANHASLGTVTINGGSSTFANGSVFPALTSITHTGSTLDLGDAPVSLTTLSVVGNPTTLASTANIVVSGSVTWDWGGRIDGSGYLVTSGNVALAGGTNGAFLNGTRTWNNNGTVTYRPTGVSIFTLGANATLDNQPGGTFDFNSSVGSSMAGSGRFENYGLVKKTLNGSVVTTSVSPNFNNRAGGTVDVQSGTLRFDGDGVDAGNYTVSTGATVGFQTSSRTIAGDISGAGSAMFSPNAASATITVAGTYNIGGNTQVVFSGGSPKTLTFNGTVVNVGSCLSVSGGGTTDNVNFNTVAGGEATAFAALTNISVTGGNTTFKNGTVFGPLTNITRSGSGTLDLANAPVTTTNMSVLSNFATLTSTANITVTGLLDWDSGADIAGTGYLITSGNVTLAGSTNGAALIDPRTWNNTGYVNYFSVPSTSIFTLGANTTLNNLPGGTFNFAGTNGGTLTGTGLFLNTGLVTRSTNNTVAVSPSFNNQVGGTLQVGAGTLQFNSFNSGTNYGTITLAGGNVSTNGANLVNAGSGFIGGNGTLNLTSATLTNNGTVSPGGTGNVGTLNITGRYTQTANGTLAIDIASANSRDVLAVTSNAILGGNLTVTMLGNYTPAGGDTHVVLTAANVSGTFANVSGAGALTSQYNTANFTLGLFGKFWDGGGGNLDWFNALNWTGDVLPTAADDVTIDFAGSNVVTIGTANAAVAKSITSNEALSISAGSLTFSNASVFNSSVSISGGTFNAGGDATFDTLSLSGTGTITGSGNLTVTNALNWQFATAVVGSASIQGTGLLTTANTSTATLTSNAFNIDATLGRSWNHLGTATYNTSNSLTGINLAAGVVLTNKAGANLTLASVTGGDGFFGAGTLLNEGALTKSSATVEPINALFTNNGTVSVTGGNLQIGSAGSDTGAYSVGAGAALYFSGGTRTLSAPSSVSGAGTVRFTGATVAVLGDYNVPTATQVTAGSATLSGANVTNVGLVTVSGGTANFTGANTVFNTSALTLSGGTLNISTGSAKTFANVALSGASLLTGSDDLTVTNALNWQFAGGAGDASITGTGLLVTANTSTATLSSNLFNWDSTLGRTWDHYGAATFNTSQGLSGINVSAGKVLTIQPGATFNFASSTGGDGLFGAGSVVNQGTITKSGTTTDPITAAFTNNGTVNVLAGTLQINSFAGGTNNGSIFVASGANLSTNGSSLLNAATGQIGGSGTIDLASATLTNSGTVAPGGTGNVGTLSITGSYTQTANGTLAVDIASANSRDLLAVSGNAILGGNLAVTMLGNYVPAGGDTHVVLTAANVTGTFASITGNLTLGPQYNGANFTLLDANALTRYWDGEGATDNWFDPVNWSGNVVPTASEAVVIDEGANNPVVFVAGNAAQALSISSNEALSITGGSLAFSNASVFNSSVSISGTGTFNAGGAATITTLNFSGGALTGTGEMALLGNASSWSGGTFSGNLRVAPGATLALNGGTKILSGATGVLVNQGNVVWSAGNIEGVFASGTATTITNQAGALFDIQGNQTTSMNSFGGGASSATLNFVNQSGAELRRSSGTGTTQLGFAPDGDSLMTFNLQNAGTFNVATGTVLMGVGGFASNTNNGSVLIGSAAALSTNGALLINAANGIIGGSGTLNLGGATLTNNGTVAPGGIGTVGTLTVTGNYTQTANGTLAIDIASANSRDLLAVSGNVTLAGTLAANVGYAPGAYDKHIFLTYQANGRTGTFASVTGNGALPLAFKDAAGQGILGFSGKVWDGGANTANWLDAANWDGDSLPTAADDVVLDIAGNNPVITIATGGALANTLTSNESITLSSGSLALTGGNSSMLAGTTFNLAGGTLQGNGSIAIFGDFLWGAGTVRDASTLTTSGNTTISGAAVLNFGRTWVNLGAVTMTSTGSLNFANSFPAWFNNALGGTLAVNSSQAVPFTISGGFGEINNAGTITWNTPAIGQVHSQVTLNNTGNVNVLGGTMQIAGPGTDAGGQYAVSGGATLQFSGGARTLAGAADITGAGNVSVTGSTVNVGSNYSIAGTGNTAITGGTLNLSTAGLVTFTNGLSLTGGALAGTGNVSIPGTFTWTGGTVRDASTLTTSGNTTISGAAVLNFGRTWVNLGAVTMTSTGSLNFANSFPAWFNNALGGTLAVNSSQAVPFTISGGFGEINNAGTITWNTPAIGQVHSQVTLNNTGNVNVLGGTMSVASTTFNQSGGVDVAAGANFARTAGFTNNGILSGAGTFNVGASTLTNNGFVMPGGAGNVGTLSITGNYLQTANGTLAIDILAANSRDVLAVSGNVTLGGTLAANVTYSPAATDKHVFLSFANGGATGSFASVTGNLPFTLKNSAGQGILGSTAKVWDGGANTANWFDAQNWDDDLVPVAADDVIIPDTGIAAVTVGAAGAAANSISSNEALSITAGTLSFSNASVFNSSLTIAGGIVTADGSANVSTLNLSSGALLGTGNVTVTGTMNWTGGGFGGSGTTTVAAGANLSIDSTAGTHTNRTFTNQGNGVWSGGGLMELNFNPSVFVNGANGVLDIRGNPTIQDNDGSGNGAGTFINAGLLQRTTSSGTVTLNAITVNNNAGGTFNINTGTVAVSAGTFNQDGTVSLSAAALNLSTGGTGGGSYVLGAGGQVNFTGGTQTFNTGAGISGPGLFKVAGGTMTVDAASMNVTNLQLASGVIAGSGALNVTGNLSWIGGGMVGAGTTTVATGAGLTIDSTAGTYLDRAFTNQGNGVWTGGGLMQLNVNASSIVNAANATLTIQGDPTIQDNDGSGNGAGTFTNAGLLRRTTSNGTVTLNALTVNNNAGATFNINTGTVVVSAGAFNQNGSMNVAAGATLARSEGFTNNGTISGTGTIDVGAATLYNDGTILPGGNGTVGTLTVQGEFFQGSGTLGIDVAGNAGGQYDRLNVTGNGYIGGTVNVTQLGNFSPTSGDSFSIMVTGGTASWDFGLNWPGASAGISTPGGNSIALDYLGGLPNFWANLSVGGAWETPGAWSEGHVPIAGEDAIIGDLAGNQTITLSSGGQSARSIMFSGVGDVFAINGGGGLGLTANSSITNFTLNGGSLSGTGSIFITGAFNWTGGTISGPGLFVTANTSTSTLSGGPKLVTGRTWDNFGTATWTGGDIVLGNAAVLNNGPGATFVVSTSSAVSDNITGSGTFRNQPGATFCVSPSTAAADVTILPRFDNDGVVNLLAANVPLDLHGPGTHTGSFSLAAPGSALRIRGAQPQLLGANASVGGAGAVEVWGAILGIASGTGFSPSTLVVKEDGGAGGVVNVAPGQSVSVAKLMQSNGSINGGAGASLAASSGFSQLNGSIAGFAQVNATQGNGALLVNDISADNVVLNAPGGAIVSTGIPALNVVSQTLDLVAASGIGDAAPLRTDVSNVRFVNGANTVRIANAGPMTLSASSNSAGDTFVSAGGALTQFGTLNLNGQATFNAPNVQLNLPGNVFSGPVSVFSSGGVNLATGGALVFGVSAVGGNLLASAASITQSGAIASGGTTALIANTGNILLANASNDFGTFAVSTPGSVAVADANALTLGPILASGGVVVNAGGALSQIGVLNGSSLTVNSVGGASLNIGNNVPTLNLTNTGGGNVVVDGASPSLTVTNASASGTGNLQILNTGSLNVAGNVNSGGGALLVALGGPVTNTGSVFASNVAGLQGLGVTNSGSVQGAGGVVMNAFGQTLTNSGTVTNGGAATQVTLRADNMTLSGGSIDSGAGLLLVRSNNDAQPISLGAGGTGLGLSNGELATLVGVLQVGAPTHTGGITVDGVVTRTSPSALNTLGSVIFNYGFNVSGGGSMVVNGNSINVTNGAVSARNIALSAPGGITVQPGVSATAGAMVNAANDLTINTGTGALVVRGSDTASLGAKLQAGNAVSIAAGSVTVAGGSAASAPASIDPLLVTIAASGNVVVQGGGTGSFAQILGGSVTIGGANVQLLGGAGSNAHAVVGAGAGGATIGVLNGGTVDVQAGNGEGANAAFVSLGTLAFNVDCPTCVVLADNPYSPPSLSASGYYGAGGVTFNGSVPGAVFVAAAGSSGGGGTSGGQVLDDVLLFVINTSVQTSQLSSTGSNAGGDTTYSKDFTKDDSQGTDGDKKDPDAKSTTGTTSTDDDKKRKKSAPKCL